MEPPLGTEGRKATHDFLSLYSSSAAHNQQDLSPPRGMYLRTHDFLQPLERVEQHVTKKKEDITGGVASVDRPPAPVEHVLPGGVGTYSISYFNQMVLNPEGGLFTTTQPSSHTRNDENSNCSSYSGGSFTLWDESATKKGKTGKENTAAERHILREAGVNVVGGQCTPFLEKSSHSSPNHRHNAASFSSFSSPQPSSSQKNQSFMDMMTTSAMNDLEEEEEEEDNEEEISIKKEPSSYSKGNLSVKVEAKTIDQKPNTPRSKHSATEQRRRSKINDRFHKLREIIPNSEQKRDKASFLLEVIDYIQFLQEKVNRYESSYNVSNQEPSKIMHGTWQQKKCNIGEGLVRSDCAPAATLVFGKKLEEGKEGVCPSSVREGVQAASPKGKGKSKSKGVVDKKMREEEVMSIDESGRPSVYYSQGVLNSVRETLGRSGVDVSEASICVEIHLGKRESSQAG